MTPDEAFEKIHPSGRPPGDNGSIYHDRRGYFRSGWAARQPEIDGLKEEARSWKGVAEAQRNVIQDLRAQVGALTRQRDEARFDVTTRSHNAKALQAENDQIRAQVEDYKTEGNRYVLQLRADLTHARAAGRTWTYEEMGAILAEAGALRQVLSSSGLPQQNAELASRLKTAEADLARAREALEDAEEILNDACEADAYLALLKVRAALKAKPGER
jgi:uncharacterized coiled-coil DUF342 family protein